MNAFSKFEMHESRPGGKLTMQAVGTGGRADLPLKGLVGLLQRGATKAATNKEAKAAADRAAEAKEAATKAAADAKQGGPEEKAAAEEAMKEQAAAEKEAENAKVLASAMEFLEEVEEKDGDEHATEMDEMDGDMEASDPAKPCLNPESTTEGSESSAPEPEIFYTNEAGFSSMRHIQSRIPALRKECQAGHTGLDGVARAAMMLATCTAEIKNKAQSRPDAQPEESAVDMVNNARAAGGLSQIVEVKSWEELHTQLTDTKAELKTRNKDLMEKVKANTDMLSVMLEAVESMERVGNVEEKCSRLEKDNEGVKKVCYFVLRRLAEESGKHSALKKLAKHFRIHVAPEELQVALDQLASK